jgi:hypothetical protein
MDVCVRLFCVWTVLCVGSSLAMGSSPAQGVLPTVYRLRNWLKRPLSQHILMCNMYIIIIIKIHYTFLGNQDSSVGIVIGYEQDDRGIGVQVPEGSRIFFSSRLPDRLWGPLSLLSNGYWGIFPRE